MADLASFRARYPEFDSVADARVELFLADAALEMGESCWGDLYDRGQSALAAHLLTISIGDQSAVGGIGIVAPLSERTVGDVSLKFAQAVPSSGSNEAYFGRTTYGQEYMRLMRLLGCVVYVVE